MQILYNYNSDTNMEYTAAIYNMFMNNWFTSVYITIETNIWFYFTLRKKIHFLQIGRNVHVLSFSPFTALKKKANLSNLSDCPNFLPIF